MPEKVIMAQDGSSALLPGISAIMTNKNDPEPIIAPAVLPFSLGYYAPWGEDNLFPQKAITDAELSTIIPSALEFKAEALYSNGLVYGTITNDPASGEDRLTPISDPQIDKWMSMFPLNNVLMKMCLDFYYLYNLWPQFVLSNDRSQIVFMAPGEAAFCRMGLQDRQDNNEIKNIFMNANWGLRAGLVNMIELPLLDVFYDGVNKLRARKDSPVYCYPVAKPGVGKSYYQVAPWDAIRKSKWFDVAKAIPLFKKALMQNQTTLKYHIEVSNTYWTHKYPDFESLTIEDKKKIMKDELSTFNDLMIGSEKSGKSMMTTYFVDPHTGKESAGWRINAIDNKIKDGIYIEDSQEASSHHYSALGVDPTILGSSPGKMMGAGSGSDKWAAINIYVNNHKADQDLILQPLQFIADYNGWTKKYPGLTFWFRNYWISTLATGQMEKQPTAASNAN